MARRISTSKRRSLAAQVMQIPATQPDQFRQLSKILSQDQIEDIHERSLSFLENYGLKVLSKKAQKILKAAGADVDDNTDMVRYDRGLVTKMLSTVPPKFTWYARNPNRNLEIGGNKTAFMAIASAPNASDILNGRRPGTQEDFQNLVRLSHSLNTVSAFGGYPVEPVDLPASTRHLDCVYDFLTLSDKPFRIYALGASRILDGIEMSRIALNLSEEELLETPCVISNININSPLLIDEPMLDGLIEMSSRNQPVIITPFTLAGAMAPISIAGALLQQNIEALAGVIMTQAVRPGAPVIYGCFTSNVDMKSGAPAFGTPEYLRAALAGGQLARFYGIPYRSSNANASNIVDAQATYESLFSLQGALGGGAHIVQHALGWLEGGLTASFEKMVLDAELLQSLITAQAPIDTSEEEFAIEAMREVGPGGHYFGSQHTMERYENAFYSPLLSDWRNFGAWEEAGSPSALTRASKISQKLINDYQPPEIDPAIKEELRNFIIRRKKEGGAIDG